MLVLLIIIGIGVIGLAWFILLGEWELTYEKWRLFFSCEEDQSECFKSTQGQYARWGYLKGIWQAAGKYTK
jgi:hypothetical protein